MTQRWVWAGLVALYVAFFVWYTPLKGPLSKAEIDHSMGLLDAGGATPHRRALWRGSSILSACNC